MKHNRIFFYLILLIGILNISDSISQPNNAFVRRYAFVDGRYSVFSDVFQTMQGDYALTGTAFNDISNIPCFWLLVLSSDGEVNFQRCLQPPDNPELRSYGASLIQTDDGGYVMGGYTSRDQSRRYTVTKANNDGDLIWWSEFGGDDAGECFVVIELKSDDILAGGSLTHSGGYAVKIDENGNQIWARIYENMYIRSIRETDDGYLLAGANRLIKVDVDGEVEWEQEFEGGIRGLVSCIGGGYAMCGQFGNNHDSTVPWLVRVEDDGDEIWSREFRLDNRRSNYALSLVQMPDEGFTLVGKFFSYDTLSFILKTDEAGNAEWIRYDSVGERMNYYSSVIRDQAGFTIAAGGGRWIRDGAFGILTKVIPVVSAPRLLSYTPEELEFNVLLRDSVEFSVQAMDLQEDSLRYVWTLEDDRVSVDSSTTIGFPELGEKTVRCIVSDEELSDSLQWTVHVNEFYIEAFQPDSLELTVRRGNSVEFTLGVRALEEIEVDYSWTFIDRNQRMHQLDAESDSISFEFEFAGDQAIIGEVTRGEVSHDLRWNVQVRSNVWYWWPHELVMSVPEDTMMEFKVFPFEDEEDSLELEYSWFLDGNGVDADSNVIELRMSDIGAHVVSALVSDSLEADTIVWELDVYDPAGISDRIGSLLPVEAILYPTSPNPFNSKVNLSFHLPQPEFGELTIYDLSGRKVQDIFRGRASSGKTSFTWDATFRPAGVYLVEFRTSSTTYVRKIILLR